MKNEFKTHQVEIFGTNRVVESLLKEGIESAIPIKDRGVDLIGYQFGDVGKKFKYIPIQIKASSGTGFSVDRKYSKINDLYLTYVWRAPYNDFEIFILKYDEAIEILKMKKYDLTASWINDGKYSVTNSGVEIKKLLKKFDVKNRKWVDLLK